MIEFTVKDSVIKITVDTGTNVPKPCLINDWWDCGRPAVAQIVLEHINRHLSEHLQGIRRESYDEGHADGRQKQRKKRCFSGHL